eukprot:CAMPEP_0185691162 /NCGR_PEP_ID=MMETSP1164-20130828/1621_2 /TAXON_ID=1104430 /ORGANISM="Chrysoreinhardia sp, Strain CCMP2950" /LENGTH=304 /DNA_ID=CAMNT_0028357801 /DNA_START=46 /DNA_END=958 /DNA_ORIENTATION=-
MTETPASKWRSHHTPEQQTSPTGLRPRADGHKLMTAHQVDEVEQREVERVPVEHAEVEVGPELVGQEEHGEAERVDGRTLAARRSGRLTKAHRVDRGVTAGGRKRSRVRGDGVLDAGWGLRSPIDPRGEQGVLNYKDPATARGLSEEDLALLFLGIWRQCGRLLTLSRRVVVALLLFGLRRRRDQPSPLRCSEVDLALLFGMQRRCGLRVPLCRRDVVALLLLRVRRRRSLAIPSGRSEVDLALRLGMRRQCSPRAPLSRRVVVALLLLEVRHRRVQPSALGRSEVDLALHYGRRRRDQPSALG